MKLKYIALLLVAVLPLVGFECMTDNFTVALNMAPFEGTWAINPGTNTNYAGSKSINPADLYDDSYEITGASVYDVRISTAGPNLGTCSGTVYINNVVLLTYNGPWTAFNTPQSLLNSTYITRNAAGIAELISCVSSKPTRMVTLRVAGSVTTSPVPAGCSMTVQAFVQAYGRL